MTMSNPHFGDMIGDPTIQFIIGDATTNNGEVVDGGTLSKGRAKGTVGTFTVNARQGTASYVTTKASLQTVLATFNVTNTTVKAATVQIPIYIFFNNAFYGDTFSFSYTATAGRTGKGK